MATRTMQSQPESEIPAARVQAQTLDREETPARRSADVAEPRIGGPSLSASESESRHKRIAEAAYYRAERRNFGPGHELDDWLAAEQEIDAASTGGA